MTSKFKQKVATIAVATGIVFGASACGQFAPASDVPHIANAVKMGIVEQERGSIKSNCDIDGVYTYVKGVKIAWYSSSTDNGYVCVGPISESRTLYNNVTGYDNPNNGRPFYPVAYTNTVGNANNATVLGVAAVQADNSIQVQICSGFNLNIETIATIKVPGWKNPFAVAQRQ